MSPAATRHSTAVARAPDTPPSIRMPEEADNATIANATSRTTVTAAPAATTAIVANVAQSMPTDDSSWSGGQVGGYARRRSREVVDVGRGDRVAPRDDVDPRG